MLKKLLKYDLKSMVRLLVPLSLAVIGTTIAGTAALRGIQSVNNARHGSWILNSTLAILFASTILALISQTFLGRIGLLILAVTVTLACLKTAVGLITSCSETFTGLFPKGPAYRVWAVIFTLVSLIFANFGLSAIIDYAVPVLMFLYPLAIVLILLALFGKFFSHDKKVYNWVISLTLISALYDLLRTLPAALRAACHLDGIIEAIGSVLPLAGLGLGWICPAAVGLVIGLVAHSTAKAKKQTA